jgi:hypothetical protein
MDCKPIHWVNLPTLYIPAGLKVVVAIKQSDGLKRISLDEAHNQGWIALTKQSDNLFGAVSSFKIQIKNSRVHIAVVPAV